MEKELNIAAILKDKPEYTKLWSDTFGAVFLTECMEDSFCVKCRDDNLVWSYSSNGTFRKYMGIMSIFPSKSMRSWEKFAWKKGDVLKVEIGSSGCSCIFDRFTNDDYTEFTGVFDKYLDRFDSFATSDWCKVTDEKEYESIIQRIETQYGGKLNLDTLKIEKPQFKDGDIVFVECVEEREADYIVICKNINNHKISDYCSLNINSSSLDYTGENGLLLEFYNLRLATDSEKQQLFAALSKENKAWDAEKKAIVNLPKKCELKAFDKVLAKFDEDLEWMPDFFYYYDNTDNEMPYVCIANGRAIACIPYNDQTAHLLGTTDDWKGGEE